MFKLLAGVILLLAGMFPSVSSAEEFILRFENVFHKEIDEDFYLRIVDSGEKLDLLKSKGTVTELLELPVKSGERFYCKARFDKKTIELRGNLKPGDKPGQFALHISAAVTTFTGSFIPKPDGWLVELPGETSAKSTIALTVGKPELLAGMARLTDKGDKIPRARKPDLQWMCVTLEAVTSDD